MLDEIVARAPAAGPQPTTQITAPSATHRRAGLAVAAAILVVAGIGGVYAVKSRNSTTPSASPDSTNPLGRPDGAITDPRSVDFGMWIDRSLKWPIGQPSAYLVFDTGLQGWTQLDETGAHTIGDGPSYTWSSNVNDPGGRQFHVSISDSERQPRTADGEQIDINGSAGVASNGEVSWPIDTTHTGTVIEFGTTETARAVALARQLHTTTIPALPGANPPDPTITTDPADGFAGVVNGVPWSAAATPDEVRFTVDRTSSITFGGDATHRIANQPDAVTAVGSNLCVLISSYLDSEQTTVQLILSDGTTINLPTQPLDNGEYWFGACLPYELDAVSVRITRPDRPEPDQFELTGSFMEPSFGSTDLIAD